jgi:predicted Fe-Mo cluster-binding NifX family protein
MKVAASTEGVNVSAHFGRCPNFTLADIHDGRIVTRVASLYADRGPARDTARINQNATMMITSISIQGGKE